MRKTVHKLEKVMKPIYKRILLKLSGEGLMGDKNFGMSAEVIQRLAGQIKEVHDNGVQICLVIGGGNIFRGAKEAVNGMNRTVADQIGMLATVMNALSMQNALEKIGVSVRVMSGIHIIIFAGGTGNSYFTTDTGAALRASEMQCDALFKATQVDGVYDSDPRQNSGAQRYTAVTYDEVINRQLKVMDTAAVALARENNIPIIVFAQKGDQALADAVSGQGNFTIIKQEV